MIKSLLEDELHIFMPFSHQSLIAKEQIDKELSELIYINAISEQG